MKRTPLTRKGWPKGRSARQLVKRRDRAAELDAVTDELLQRAGYRCEVCRIGRIEHRHHRLRQAQGGTHELENLLAVCHICHDFIHHHPQLSYEKGWLVRSSGFNVDMAPHVE